MRIFRIPTVLVAMSCVLLAATVTPTALGCQVAVSAAGADSGGHECCKGKQHGAACPLAAAAATRDPSCPAMRGCDTDDGVLMQLLTQAGFVPEARVTTAIPTPSAVRVLDPLMVSPLGALAPESPPPRI